MALLKLEGEIILTAVTPIAVMGGFSISIPAGRYFWNSVGTGVTRSLCDELEFQMEAAMGAGASTVTLNDGTDAATGKVTISRSGAFAIVWNSTALRDLFGFTADLGAATSHTSPNHVKYLHLPSAGRSGIMSPSTSTGAEYSDFTAARSTGGEVYAVGYSIHSEDTLDLRHQRGKKTWIGQESIVNESLQRFWRDTIALGRRIRFHADRSVDATYRTWVVLDGGHYDPRAFDERWTEGPECIWAIRYRVGEVS
jgi:hypothetical protein